MESDSAAASKRCDVCRMRLDAGYYVTCRQCGSSSCWIHSSKHQHRIVEVEVRGQ